MLVNTGCFLDRLMSKVDPSLCGRRQARSGAHLGSHGCFMISSMLRFSYRVLARSLSTPACIYIVGLKYGSCQEIRSLETVREAVRSSQMPVINVKRRGVQVLGDGNTEDQYDSMRFDQTN